MKHYRIHIANMENKEVLDHWNCHCQRLLKMHFNEIVGRLFKAACECDCDVENLRAIVTDVDNDIVVFSIDCKTLVEGSAICRGDEYCLYKNVVKLDLILFVEGRIEK